MKSIFLLLLISVCSTLFSQEEKNKIRRTKDTIVIHSKFNLFQPIFYNTINFKKGYKNFTTTMLLRGLDFKPLEDYIKQIDFIQNLIQEGYNRNSNVSYFYFLRPSELNDSYLFKDFVPSEYNFRRIVSQQMEPWRIGNY